MTERRELKHTVLSWIRKAMTEPYSEAYGPDEHFDWLAEPTIQNATGLPLIKACCELLTDARERIIKVEGRSPGRVVLVSFPITNNEVGLQNFKEQYWDLCGSPECKPPTIHVHQGIPWSAWPFRIGSEMYWKGIALPIGGYPEIRAGFAEQKDHHEEPHRLCIYLEMII
jgi:hypothetical protein